MKIILEKLFNQYQLTSEEAENILKDITSGKYSNEQIASFLTVFNMRPISVDELKGFRKALLDLAIPVDLSAYETIDMCGTGGDGKNTFNISTLASFIVAGAGYKVAKHGNYGVSSVSGSSNVLESLGYEFTNDEKVLQQQIESANITFLHAPKFHPAMAAVAPVRRALKMKTFFNMLGPIVNPARPTHQMAGVFSLELARLYHYLFQEEQGKRFAVIYGLDGYDEISLTDDFLMRNNLGEHLLNPSKLGLPKIEQNELFGGNTVDEAVEIFKKIIQGNGTQAQNNTVCANAAIAIGIMNNTNDFLRNFEEAKASLLEGKALKSLKIITS